MSKTLERLVESAITALDTTNLKYFGDLLRKQAADIKVLREALREVAGRLAVLEGVKTCPQVGRAYDALAATDPNRSMEE